MKQTLAIFFVAGLLVFSLTACGTDSNTNDKMESTAGSSMTDNNGGTMDDGYVEDPVTGAPQPSDGSMTGDTGTTTDGASAASQRSAVVMDGTNAVNRVATETTDAARQIVDEGEKLIQPASYHQMLRNARVHDTDGFLHDGENDMTPGIKH